MQDFESVLKKCQERMKVGSISFNLASVLLSKDIRTSVQFLYSWCRYCDDEIDEKSGNLSRLRLLTAWALRSGAHSLENVDVAFEGLRLVSQRYSIPEKYFLDLLQGMELDKKKQSYSNLKELLEYCYFVAGTVGLMMSHIMGVSHRRALEHAVSLGIAMQLTNIARDILDDAKKDRIYLPISWLHQYRIPTTPETFSQHKEELFEVVQNLLFVADDYYQRGIEGLKYLSIRSGFSILSAALIYRQIGREVLARKSSAWDSRVVVPTWKKLFFIFKAAFMLVPSLPYRFSFRWRPLAPRVLSQRLWHWEAR